MDITKLTVHELQDKMASKELTATEIAEAYAKKIAEKEPEIDAFVTVLTNEAVDQAKKIDEDIKAGKTADLELKTEM